MTEIDADPDQPAGDDAEGQELPASIELAWGRRERPTRGPKRGLTLERVVAAGIKVAMTDGIGALSMGRVAAELGVATMSLYRYVSAKDELLTIMVDTALGPPVMPAQGIGWRAGMTAWAVGIHDAYRRQPWSLRVPINAPPLGPNNVLWLEAALRSLAETELSEQDKLFAIILVSGFVRNDATLIADVAATEAAQPVRLSYGGALSQLIDPRRFPAVQRTIESGAFDDDDDPELGFVYGLERILDGLEVLVERSRRPPSAD